MKSKDGIKTALNKIKKGEPCMSCECEHGQPIKTKERERVVEKMFINVILKKVMV